MRERILRLGLVGVMALTLPAGAGAAGPAKGLANAATHAHGNVPTTVGQPAGSGKPETAGERPHNHGWYVSQVARDKGATATSADGGSTHGAAVSAVAKGDQGKSH